MPRAPNYFKFHLGDYAKDCEDLTLLQHGAYLALIRWYYATGRPIPADGERIYRRCHALSGEEKGAVMFVLTEFFQLDGPVWRHRRIDRELAEWSDRSDEASASAKARWNKINDNGNANAMRTQCDGNANQNQEPRTRRLGSVSENTLRPVRLRATRLPPDWRLPDEYKDFAVKVHHLEPERAVRVSLAFRDYWIAKPGGQGTKLDWFATWRNWIRKETHDA